MWGKNFISQMVATATNSAVKLWVWPSIAPLVGTVIGWYEGVSFFYLWVGGVLAAAGGAGFLVWLEQWKGLNRVENKLSITKIRTLPIGKPGDLRGIRLGVQLKNHAHFPVDFKVTGMRSSMDFMGDKTVHSPNKERQRSAFVIPPNEEWWVDDYDIEIPNDLRGPAIAALECEMLYGKKGKLAYTMEIDRKSQLTVSDNSVEGSEDWHES